ncbi:MAG: Na+/H+ antiporter subunit E [Methanomicrobiaceae archaeon]|nr:Na+/H+ antiporter subunit E [Methanomicrobiaceae archaeon]
MIAFLVTALFAYLVYLVLTAGSGTIGLWSQAELIAGGGISLVVAAISRKFFCRTGEYRMANPLRWVLLVAYAAVPFFIEMARANIDVAYRVITGKIRPGIVKLSTGLETDLGVLLLANSITLTPGTLTVGVDEETNDLYVHMINIGMGTETKESFEPDDVFALFQFPEWIRRIAE